VNNVPHLGNIIGCVLPADIIARYHKAKGNVVCFVCGADEYGTATEVKAREEGITPRELCDKYYPKHKEIYDWFGIDFDVWGRTSTPNPRTDLHTHTTVSQDIFLKLYRNGYLEEREVTQLYCPAIQRFVADRFIQGTCPKCGDISARGDQCDKCQAIYESTELLDSHLRGDLTAKLELRTSHHLFLRLDLLQDQIRAWFDGVKHKWAANAVSVTEDWLTRGLQPRCVTRDMDWGTPLPDGIQIEGKEHKVMYNWFDAPIGYISIIGILEWWTDPCVRLIQFMGVDNVPFHSILFPGSLMGTNEDYVLVSEIASVHYLNFEGGKFSKTEGRGIFGDEVMKKGIHHDYWRYYLMKIRPEDDLGPGGKQHGNANFTWDDFMAVCTADLCNNIGNLIHRTFELISKYFGGAIAISDDGGDETFLSDVLLTVNICEMGYETNRIAWVIRNVINLSAATNKYLTDKAPWKLHKENPSDPEIARTIITVTIAILAVVGLLGPIMPETTARIMSFTEMRPYKVTVKPGYVPFFPPIAIAPSVPLITE
jgi:methionyl-tRNA synthetase